MNRVTVLLSLVAAASGCRLSDREPPEIVGCLAPYRDVEQLATEQLSNRNPGDAALIVRVNDHTVCRLFFGAYTPESAVPTASAAKWLTAAAVMTVVDDGKLAVDTRTSAQFPHAPANTAGITVSQLLSHTSGLLWFSRCMGKPNTTLQACAEEILDSDQHFDPGMGFFYSGPPFTVAGAMAERASGKSWAVLFRERIAEPLGMSHTSYGTHANPALSEGDAVSTADDYARFAEMMLHGGLFRGRRVLSEAAVAQMRRNWTAGVPVVSSPNGATPYGLGAWLNTLDASGNGTVLSSPGVGGFVPIVDYGRQMVIVFQAADERIWPAANAIIAGARAAVDRER